MARNQRAQVYRYAAAGMRHGIARNLAEVQGCARLCVCVTYFVLRVNKSESQVSQRFILQPLHDLKKKIKPLSNPTVSELIDERRYALVPVGVHKLSHT